MAAELAPHALLRIAGLTALASSGALPAWADAAMSRAPWVVVRRAPGRERLIPVGVRGLERSARHAAWLNAAAVLECVTPPELAARRAWRGHARAADVPALAALDAVEALMRREALVWGPGGSVGFELATGVATATAASDLDLVVQARVPLGLARAAALGASLAQLPVRADVLLETPHGAVALDEYASARAPLVLRTAHGPRLVADPWSDPAAAA